MGDDALLARRFGGDRSLGISLCQLRVLLGEADKSGQPAFGTGHYTRANTELCLLGIKGRMQRRDALDARNVEQVIMSPRRQHSGKPDEAYTRIERMFDGPKIELFARQHRAGWDTAYAHEVGKFGESREA